MTLPPACAKDIMHTDVIAIPASTDVWDLARQLTTLKITGAPVTDERGFLIGVVSQTDIVRHLKELVQVPPLESDFYAQAEVEDLGRAARPLTARDLMSPRVIQAQEETPVQELANIMTRHRVHRIIITRGHRIMGIVTTMDILKVL
ncbi:MAG: CBS domain-containing protein [Elusimicrobia bacterium]|nr:CBS domain-containing protein [Elusimicrobiota bacterium]